MTENLNEIAPAIYLAIEILKTCWGGVEIEIVGDKMYRLPPDEYAKAGMLGIDITMRPAGSSMEPIKTFLGCESMAEIIAYEPWGRAVADDFVYNLLGKQLREETNKLLFEKYAVYEKVPAHGRDANGIILGPFNSEEEAIDAGEKYGYNTDNYYVDKIVKNEGNIHI